MPAPRELLQEMFRAAVQAADPMRCVAPALPPLARTGRILVVGAGKAAASMARAVEAAWAPDLERIEGLVITRYGHALASTRPRACSTGCPDSMPGTSCCA